MAIPLRYLVVRAVLATSLSLALRLQAEPLPALELRFTVFAPSQLTGLAYVAESTPTQKIVPVVFYPTARSPVYVYRGAAPLQFVDLQSKTVVAIAEIPLEMHQPLLIFFPHSPSPGSGLRYEVYVHDDAPTRHTAGGLAILNFSGMEITGKIGRQVVELQRGFSGPYQVGKSVRVSFRIHIDNVAYQAYADTIRMGPDGRALLVLLPPFYKGSYEAQSRVLLDEPVQKPEKTKG